MKNLRDLLQEADPLRYEQPSSLHPPGVLRQAVLASAAAARTTPNPGGRPRIAVFATAFVMVIAAAFIGALAWSLFIRDLQAAIRFEVRLAEDRPAHGLREAKALGSDRTVYLHEEVVVANSDIAAARVIQGTGPSGYWVSVDFTALGAEKMRAATRNHLGRPLAILIDGQVAVAPVVRTPIGESAVISGSYTKTQAERIVRGIGIR
jgi:hypothetical protein